MNFSSQIFFNNINHGHRLASYIEKKIFAAASLLHGHGYLLLLSQSQETRKKPVFPFLLTMLMCSAIVSYLLKYTYTQVHEEVSRKMYKNFIKNYQINIKEKITSDFRGVFRIRLNIYDRAFLRIQLHRAFLRIQLHRAFLRIQLMFYWVLNTPMDFIIIYFFTTSKNTCFYFKCHQNTYSS